MALKDHQPEPVVPPSTPQGANAVRTRQFARRSDGTPGPAGSRSADALRLSGASPSRRPSRRDSKSVSPRHGLTRLKAAVRGLGGRLVDRRTTLGKALAEWRQELIQDLGGPDAVSTQVRAIVDLAVRTKLLLDSIDAWLLTQPSLVNKRARALLPVVRERQQLADALARYLALLGLERVPTKVNALNQYVVEKYGDVQERA